LREQRQHLVERELLLDTVVQNTPVAMLLTNDAGRVAYANLAARRLLGRGRSLEGADFAALLGDAPPALRAAIEAGVDSVLSVPIDGVDESFHVSRRHFRLHGRGHDLHLLRRMTRELSRQEVASWKRLIRVISHELNNSLAPISSLAHSGAEIARRGEAGRLPDVFESIGARARHLHGFIDGYARFAKLPAPRHELVDWPAFLATLAAHAAFRLEGDGSRRRALAAERLHAGEEGLHAIALTRDTSPARTAFARAETELPVTGWGSGGRRPLPRTRQRPDAHLQHTIQ